jgi:probable addiction module antidote protein
MAGKPRLKRWNSAAHLKTEKDIGRYWEACVEEGSDCPAVITAGLASIARTRGLKGLAQQAGLTREELDVALSPDGNPEFGTVMRVIRALGLELKGAATKG